MSKRCYTSKAVHITNYKITQIHSYIAGFNIKRALYLIQKSSLIDLKSNIEIEMSVPQRSRSGGQFSLFKTRSD